MSDTAKKRRRLLTQMRVQRFRKRNKLISNMNSIEKIDSTDSACTFSRSDTNDVNYKNREVLSINTVNEDNEFVNESINENEESVSEVSVNEDEESINEEFVNEDEESINEEFVNEDEESVNENTTFNKVSDNVKYNEMEQLMEQTNDISLLRQWALKYKVKHDCLDDLLKILRRKCFPDLPKTAKTFLKTTSAEYNIENISEVQDEGQFVYFGIIKYLQTMINIHLYVQNTIELLINIDGVPLFNSSSKQLWPILCKIYFQPDIYEPFPVAVYCGNHKPPNIDKYLEPFIKEISNLYREGILINERHFHVHIKAFICDRPARSLIKCIKNHGGYHACERCEVPGIRVNKRTIYPLNNNRQRTDRSFRNAEDALHHTGISPLISLPEINMVTMFVLDFMHLCCLGIMKKMFVDFWLNSKSAQKLSNTAKLVLSKNLLKLQNQVPEDFQRTTRSITEIAKWKATEFRFFLLYCGPILIKKCLSEDLYKHFLLLHVACRILCSPETAIKCNEHAKLFLHHFVVAARQLYGEESQILNTHSLVHLADDAVNMQCSLTEITAFPFENALGKIKSLIRSGNRPLPQLCRRIHERFFISDKKITIPLSVEILKKNKKQIKKIKYKNTIITTKSPNNTVILLNGKILQVNNIYTHSSENEIQISGINLKIMKAIFEYPCNSSELKMWKIKNTSDIIVTPLSNVLQKMVTFVISDDNNEEKIYTMPFLHT